MKNDEKSIKSFLAQYELETKPFSKKEKRASKTPDFRVFQRAKFVFFCEVKSIRKDTWESGLRNDPIYNRLTDDIHTAVKQFDSVNPSIGHPNVLAIVNHDEKCGALDLYAVITGTALVEDGPPLPIFLQFSEGRIKEEKLRIHLFIWLDDYRPKKILFNPTHKMHHHALCKCFSIDPNSIKTVGS